MKNFRSVTYTNVRKDSFVKLCTLKETQDVFKAVVESVEYDGNHSRGTIKVNFYPGMAKETREALLEVADTIVEFI